MGLVGRFILGRTGLLQSSWGLAVYVLSPSDLPSKPLNRVTLDTFFQDLCLGLPWKTAQVLGNPGKDVITG